MAIINPVRGGGNDDDVFADGRRPASVFAGSYFGEEDRVTITHDESAVTVTIDGRPANDLSTWSNAGSGTMAGSLSFGNDDGDDDSDSDGDEDDDGKATLADAMPGDQ